MVLAKLGDLASRFSAYVAGLTSVIGHAARARPLRDYCTGLMMPYARKSVEPMVAMTARERTAAQHQALLHFVGQGDWSDQRVLAKVRELVLPELVVSGQSQVKVAIEIYDAVRIAGCVASAVAFHHNGTASAHFHRLWRAIFGFRPSGAVPMKKPSVIHSDPDILGARRCLSGRASLYRR